MQARIDRISSLSSTSIQNISFANKLLSTRLLERYTTLLISYMKTKHTVCNNLHHHSKYYRIACEVIYVICLNTSDECASLFRVRIFTFCVLSSLTISASWCERFKAYRSQCLNKIIISRYCETSSKAVRRMKTRNLFFRMITVKNLKDQVI